MTGLVQVNWLEEESIPEYPQKPVVHLKSPIAIRISGIVTHWEVDFLAGQRIDAKGKAGCAAVFLLFVVRT